jgi:hypothetical protein
MPTPTEHRAKALENENFLDSYNLAEGKFAGWAVTVLFYAALHWFRALAAQEGVQITRYTGRKDQTDTETWALDKLPLFRNSPESIKSYQLLKARSRDARYEMTVFSSADFNHLKENHFKRFKSFVNANLQR